MSISSDLAIATARRYAEGNMTATVTITRYLEPELNTVTGRLIPREETGVYTGKARVYVLVGPVLLGIGDESQEFQNSYVSIPISVWLPNELDVLTEYETDVRVDDVVHVDTHPDPGLVGRWFRVTDVESGGQFPAVRRCHVMGVEDTSHFIESGAPEIPVDWQ